jgi:hypothetical protein
MVHINKIIINKKKYYLFYLGLFWKNEHISAGFDPQYSLAILQKKKLLKVLLGNRLL